MVDISNGEDRDTTAFDGAVTAFGATPATGGDRGAKVGVVLVSQVGPPQGPTHLHVRTSHVPLFMQFAGLQRLNEFEPAPLLTLNWTYVYK